MSAGEFGWYGAVGTYRMADPVKNTSVVIGVHLAGWTAIFNDKYLEIVKQIYEELLGGEEGSA